MKSSDMKSNCRKSRCTDGRTKGSYRKGRCTDGCMRDGCMKGSYTVEAAIVVTVTMFVLASLLIGTFYVHDRAVMQGLVCEAASAGSNFVTEEERKTAVQEVVKGINEERFLGSRGLNGNAASGSRSVTASWNAEYPVPGFAGRYLAQGSLDIKRSWTCKILNPADTIRKIKGVGELLTGGDK